jgi:hypothetical protein
MRLACHNGGMVRCSDSDDWSVEVRTTAGRWQCLPDTCASQAEAEDLRDMYRDEGYLRGPHRLYTSIRLVPPPGMKRQPRDDAAELLRDGTLERLAAERAETLARLPALRAQGVVAAACGHPQSLPTPAEVDACPEMLIRVCVACQELLWWHGDQWGVLARPVA